ncbi:CBS domain-containing protein, partial [Klebsiella pneumoniae]
PLERLAVGEFASQPVFTVRADDQLGDALVVLLRARVHRLAVLDAQGQVLGILEALDLFSFLANHSHLITVQIEQAADLQALEQAA